MLRCKYTGFLDHMRSSYRIGCITQTILILAVNQCDINLSRKLSTVVIIGGTVTKHVTIQVGI
jgi:hypothetical protein